MSFHRVEATIRYLTTDEGGRQNGVASGYRGQFHYLGEDSASDAMQEFPDAQPGSIIERGTIARAVILFPLDRWKEEHSKRVFVSMPFEIREGRKTVGRGSVTRVEGDA